MFMANDRFMTDGACNQSAKGSAFERRAWSAAKSRGARRRRAPAASQFNLSERQAYRYLEKASQLNRPVEIPETMIPVTLKLPPRTVELLRQYAKSSGLTKARS